MGGQGTLRPRYKLPRHLIIPSNNACLLKLVPSASFLTQSDWLEKKADQLLCICKETLGTRLMPRKTMVRAMCKCVQKRLALLQWDWLIEKIQSLLYRKKLILICKLGCVQGIIHFKIQSAYLTAASQFLFAISGQFTVRQILRLLPKCWQALSKTHFAISCTSQTASLRGQIAKQEQKFLEQVTYSCISILYFEIIIFFTKLNFH